MPDNDDDDENDDYEEWLVISALKYVFRFRKYYPGARVLKKCEAVDVFAASQVTRFKY